MIVFKVAQMIIAGIKLRYFGARYFSSVSFNLTPGSTV